MEDRKVTWNSQKDFMKGKSCLTDLVAFYNDMIHASDRGRAADVACRDLVKPLTLSHSTPMAKLVLPRLVRVDE